MSNRPARVRRLKTVGGLSTVTLARTLKFGPAIYEEETTMQSVNDEKRAVLLAVALCVAIPSFP